ncbi:hypothetical protein CANCADRAFT_57368 [Tortispora caseinolytica NRRL Y-17796]|uniref:Nitrogen regulatory protein areA GATA-like domain-containing protein n=1 Tax=Tortispora caseinolytica NRRL Y-17796 TaxID=767744 RepID=A0A1E4TGY4_9ASCO|nr:hypothetical protein CANCADRAFT_57368 [Tortispora caseinolytica NRRL Y-17796]
MSQVKPRSQLILDSDSSSDDEDARGRSRRPTSSDVSSSDQRNSTAASLPVGLKASSQDITITNQNQSIDDNNNVDAHKGNVEDDDNIGNFSLKRTTSLDSFSADKNHNSFDCYTHAMDYANSFRAVGYSDDGNTVTDARDLSVTTSPSNKHGNEADSDTSVITPLSDAESPIIANDDTKIQYAPSHHVDYLSHNWKESDVSSSWRYVVLQRKNVANSARLENASWRTWMKAKYNLRTVSPESVNWLKDYDVTWLYGPILPASAAHVGDVDYSAPKHKRTNSVSPARIQGNAAEQSMSETKDELLKASQAISTINASHAAAATKPILKRRTISEMMLSGSSMLDIRSNHMHNNRSSSVSPHDEIHPFTNVKSISYVGPLTRKWDHSLSSDNDSSMDRADRNRHIHFNDMVEQCIAITCEDRQEDGYYSDDEDESTNYSRSESSLSTRHSSPTTREGLTIHMLPSTTLKDEYKSMSSSDEYDDDDIVEGVVYSSDRYYDDDDDDDDDNDEMNEEGVTYDSGENDTIREGMGKALPDGRSRFYSHTWSDESDDDDGNADPALEGTKSMSSALEENASVRAAAAAYAALGPPSPAALEYHNYIGKEFMDDDEDEDDSDSADGDDDGNDSGHLMLHFASRRRNSSGSTAEDDAHVGESKAIIDTKFKSASKPGFSTTNAPLRRQSDVAPASKPSSGRLYWSSIKHRSSSPNVAKSSAVAATSAGFAQRETQKSIASSSTDDLKNLAAKYSKH